MLTIRSISVGADDRTAAAAAAGHPLDDTLSPRAFARAGDATARANSMWLGAAETLSRLGLERGAEVHVEELARTLRGRHAVTQASVRRPHAAASGAAIDSCDLTFWAPGSVSWLWAQGDPQTRVEIERSMFKAADTAVGHLMQSVSAAGGREPVRGCAVSVALHVMTPASPGEQTSPPKMHAHCHVVAVLDRTGTLKAPCGEALGAGDALRLGGAVGRAVLAEELGKLGFQIQAQTGPGGRYFEVAGVPEELVRRSTVWERAECG